MADCPIPNCTAVPKPGHLMCLTHWKLVPRKLGQRVNETWRNVRYDRDAYVDARDAAIDAVKAAAGQERTLL